MFGLNQQFTVCTEVTFAIPSPRGIFQDNKVISFEQSKKKIKKITNICIFSRETSIIAYNGVGRNMPLSAG